VCTHVHTAAEVPRVGSLLNIFVLPARGCPRGHFCVYVDTNIVTLKLCKFQITGYNSNRYHFLPGSTAVPRVRIFISVAKTKSELSRSPLGSWAERPHEVRRRAGWCSQLGLTGKSQIRPQVKLRYVVGIDDPHNISQFDLGADLAFVDTQPFLCKNA